MPEYRAYVFDADGHVELSIDLKVETEREARQRAKQLVDECIVELWDGPVRIARFEPEATNGFNG
jgi:hypothetical protein